MTIDVGRQKPLPERPLPETPVLPEHSLVPPLNEPHASTNLIDPGGGEKISARVMPARDLQMKERGVKRAGEKETREKEERMREEREREAREEREEASALTRPRVFGVENEFDESDEFDFENEWAGTPTDTRGLVTSPRQ